MAQRASTTEKRWNISDTHDELSRAISRALNISPLVAQVLINRGMDTPDSAQLFLSASLADLHDPFLLKDAGKAAARIMDAIEKKEKICICGDYDADGITATCVLLLFLREAGADAVFHIPSRLVDGYGMSIEAVRRLKSQGVSLIITVDCGVSDHEEVACARSLGIDVIVTDHHVPPDSLPDAYALINPKQPGCAFPFKGLAGVGVAFNLVMALRKALRDRGFWQSGAEPNLKKYLDLVALGTIADVVPMVDENRILVKNGLEVIAQGCRPGIRALKSVSGVPEGPVSAAMVGFRLAPRLNASGRVSEADLSVQLLLAPDEASAMETARTIDEKNVRRKQIENVMRAEACAMLEKRDGVPDAIVLSSATWHPGVVGLCASRLSEEFGRPAILIAMDEKSGEGRGSARTVNGFDVYSAIKECAPLLKAFGGHRDAAGLTIRAENLDRFVESFNAIVRDRFASHDYSPVLPIDAEISLGLLSYDVLTQIESLAPFGPQNPEPVFSSRSIDSYSFKPVGKGHLKMRIREDDQLFDAIGFNMSQRYSLTDEAIRLAFVPQFNFFNGQKTVQLNLRDIKVG